MGYMFAYFQEPGNIPVLMESLKVNWRGMATSVAHIFNMETDTPEWPCDLLRSHIVAV